MGRWDWERPEDEGVEHSERRGARADGEGERTNCREAGGPVFADHAQAEAEVLDERFEPDGGFRVPAGFAELERVSELAARKTFRLGARQAVADQIGGALFQVKLELVFEIGGGASGAKPNEAVGELVVVGRSVYGGRFEWIVGIRRSSV